MNTYNEILDRYKYHDDAQLKKKIQDRDDCCLEQNYNVINEIVLWKLNRIVEIQDETVELLNKISRKYNDPKEAINDKETEILIDKLLKSKGIRLPMASTILHFYAPTMFPIIDQRAYRELFGKEYISTSGFDVYKEYVEGCIDFINSKNINIEFELIDKLLYQLDKESGKKVKY